MMDVEERALKMCRAILNEEDAAFVSRTLPDIIRQAEQAAREKALEEADKKLGEFFACEMADVSYDSSMVDYVKGLRVKAIRALKEKGGKPD